MITEQDLIDCKMERHQMMGTGWNSIGSMGDAIYYYKKGRITINATEFWTWFLDDAMRNDIAVYTKGDLINLLNTYS